MFKKVLLVATVACFVPMVIDTIKRNRMRKEFKEFMENDFDKVFNEGVENSRCLCKEDEFIKSLLEELKSRS